MFVCEFEGYDLILKFFDVFEVLFYFALIWVNLRTWP